MSTMVIDGEEYTCYWVSTVADRRSEPLNETDLDYLQATLQMLTSVNRHPKGELQAHFNGGYLIWQKNKEGEWKWE